MNIIQQKWEFFQNTLPSVPKKLRHLYRFGFFSLTFQHILSLRANARLLNLNWNTAKSKSHRLVSNQRMLSVFPKLMKGLSLVNKNDVIAIDFSDFHGFQVLMFAKQTKKGRALPVYFEVLAYPIRKGSQNTFVISAIRNFSDLLGFRPCLVFDRGFACPSIVAYLCRKKHPFIIRIKKKKSVVFQKKICSVRDIGSTDTLVSAYRFRLRVIISDQKEGMDEPWYLITNDHHSSRKKIIDRYYHRFEIEEFFRDAKRLLGLEYVHPKQAHSLSIILWFLCLGLWFVERLVESSDETKERHIYRLSRTRYVFESLLQEAFVATEGKYWLGEGV